MTAGDYSLLLDFLSDDLTAAEVEGVCSRLKAEPKLAEQLIELAGNEARIAEWARSLASAEGARPFEIAQADRGPFKPTVGSGRWRGRVGLFWLGGSLTAAAAVWIAALVAQQVSGPALVGAEVDNSPTLVARVINESSDSDWYTESRSHRDRWSVHEGDVLHLNAGSVRMLFDHGTSVTLQAPAVLEVRDAMLARVQHGAVRVSVAKGAEGFSIVTPIARVIDLGTEFGVNVDIRGETEVAVFDGAVDVEGRTSDSGPRRAPRRLSTGEAMRMDELGTTSRLVSVQPGRFPVGAGQSLESSGNSGSPTIGQVLDNIERAGSFNFYEIVRGGMGEDAQAFADRRDHQWNGIDSSGMPDYLLGGDYVRTFNDDKLDKKLQITVQITRPADIYVLLDDRCQPPAWLSEEFERSEDRMGLDEGSGKYRDPAPDGSARWIQRPTGTGPGVSIDMTFSVWKRSVESAGEVILGPLGGRDWDINMYGIVAVPRIN